MLRGIGECHDTVLGEFPLTQIYLNRIYTPRISSVNRTDHQMAVGPS